MKLRVSLTGLYAHKIIKFLTVGILNTIFGYVIYAGLLFSGSPYLIALLFATLVGVVFNYFSFGNIVFNGGSSWLIFLKFSTTYALIYVLNAVGLSALISYFLLSPYIAQVFCVPPSVLTSWLLMNYWVFKRA
jgi:putative flippase GtrA